MKIQNIQVTQPVLTKSAPLPVRYLVALGRFTKKKPLGATGLYVLIFAVILAAIGPSIAPHDPWDNYQHSRLVAPDSTFWFGTDHLGRDVLSRTIYGARISIFVGLITTVFATLIGAFVGVSSAYFGGRFDLIIQRFVDAKSGFPSLLLALALMAALGASLTNVIIALTIIYSSRAVRVVRSQSLSIKETAYIDASRAIGARHLRIILRHILPNTFGVVMVIATVTLGSAILLEASLSFLGVGMPVTVISWGGMLSGDILRNFAVAPWIGIFPGFALTAVVFGINVYGDALRDILDPKLRGR
jgi:peptide/nickel transport system permease protein